jgi:hypothetical protein
MEQLPEKVRILATLFTYDGWSHCDAALYASGLYQQLAGHPRLEELRLGYARGYPTDRVRNAACKEAKDAGFDFLLMLDNDMKFDGLVDRDPDAKPFLPTSLEFALNQPAPVVVGAPYTGGPPDQRVMVMRWRDRRPNGVGGEGQAIESYTREEAAERSGIERVAALPTGCLLVDLRALDMMAPPWFSYEFGDPPYNTKLASTEDIVFTRNLDWCGVGQFVNWDAWAFHHKEFTTTKPTIVNPLDVPKAIWKRALQGDCPAQYRD